MQPVVNSASLSPWEPGVFSLVVFGLLVMALIALLLFVASWLGEKKPNAEKLRPYESGVIPTGSARLRYPVPFYLVAIFFLLRLSHSGGLPCRLPVNEQNPHLRCYLPNG